MQSNSAANSKFITDYDAKSLVCNNLLSSHLCFYQTEIARIREKVTALLARKTTTREQVVAELNAITTAVRASEDELERLRDLRLG